MDKTIDFLKAIPNWIITIVIAGMVSYTAIQLKVNSLEIKCEVLKEQQELMKSSKADKVLLDEYVKRLDRIENKLDKVLLK